MCNPVSQQQIDQILDEWVSEGRAFTAFEVSLEAKKRGSTERHRDMKRYIHQCPRLQQELQFGDYAQTMVNVGEENGQQLEAYLYHPNAFDVSSYKPLERHDAAPRLQLPQATAAVVGAITKPQVLDTLAKSLDEDSEPWKIDDEAEDNALSSDNIYSLGFADTLLVRTNYLSRIGLAPGDKVYIYAENLGEVVLAKVDPGLPSAKTQIVHSRGYVRLAKSTLQEFGIYAAKYLVTNTDTVPNGGAKIFIKGQ